MSGSGGSGAPDASGGPWPPGWRISPIGPIDCTPEAQAEREAELRQLWRRLNSGATSVGDRGRSATWASPATLRALLANLRTEYAFCATGVWAPASASRRRIRFLPLTKDL